MSLFSFIKKKKISPKHQALIHSTLNILHTDRTSLLIQHPEHDNYHYGMITDIVVDKRLMLIIDMTPDADISHWQKASDLNFSSSPKNGINYKFIAQFKSVHDQSKKQYVIHFPEQIQVIEMRQVPRVKVGAGGNISASLMVDNQIKMNSVELQSLLPEKCGYDGYLFDISNQGLQIILQGNHMDIFKKDMKISSKISAEKLTQDMNFDMEIRWSYYDASTNITRVGGSFYDLDAARREALAHLISTIQASLYHRYI